MGSVRLASSLVAALAGLLVAGALTGCGGHGGAHWPKSAGAITPDDPADDGGESLAPHRVSEQAAAVEHGGDDITSILDEPAVNATSPSPPAAAPAAPVAPPADPTLEGTPVFEEIIIVN